MELKHQSFEILEQKFPEGEYDEQLLFMGDYITEMYKHIERCARICYKSEHNITDDSYKTFVQRMIDSNHLSTLEHGAVYLKIPEDEIASLKYGTNPYSKQYLWIKGFYMITTNYRVIIENDWFADMKWVCKPTIYHAKRYTVLFHTCLHVYKDLTRHRKASFSIESTRFVNYSKTDKYGHMKFIIPTWLDLQEGIYSEGKTLTKLGEQYLDASKDIQRFLLRLQGTELDYNDLIECGWQPQQAAEILPQCIAADVVMSAFDVDWDWIFQLRTNIAATGQPHPLVKDVMNPLYDEFVKREYVLC